MLALLIYVLFAHQEIHLDANHLLLPSQVELCLLVTVVHPIQKPVLRYAMGLYPFITEFIKVAIIRPRGNGLLGE